MIQRFVTPFMSFISYLELVSHVLEEIWLFGIWEVYFLNSGVGMSKLWDCVTSSLILTFIDHWLIVDGNSNTVILLTPVQHRRLLDTRVVTSKMTRSSPDSTQKSRVQNDPPSTIDRPSSSSNNSRRIQRSSTPNVYNRVT